MRINGVLVNFILSVAACLPLSSACAQAPVPAAVTHRITLPATSASTAASTSVSTSASTSDRQAQAAGLGSVQFIGTATVLIRHLGLTILTDPNFRHKGEHVHLGYGLHADRLTNPALELSQLPPIDLVVLSHFHEDHFDKFVQQNLDRNTLIVTTGHASAALRRLGFQRTVALDQWDALELRKGDARLTVTAMPGRHGAPGISALLPPVMGSMLDFAGPDQPQRQRYRMYISGDTLIYDDIALIPHRFPGIDLALLHLGGTRILKVMKVTMDGQDGVEMLRIIAPAHAIPIHYNDYDVFKSPLSAFEQALRAAGLENKVTYLKHGERYTFPARPQ